jgi:hypothetical protein
MAEVKTIKKTKVIKFNEPENKFEPYFESDSGTKGLNVIFNPSDFNLDDFDIEIDYYETIEQVRGARRKQISFNGVSLLHCCGIIELGNIHITEGNNKVLEVLHALVTNYPGITFMINTNGRDSSKRMEEALVKSDVFVKIKSFKNANSGNTVTIWLSNNA